MFKHINIIVGVIKMLHSIGIPINSYYDSHGDRFSNSPMCHKPDKCPFYPGDTIGDCIAKCSDKRGIERPCLKDDYK